MKNKMKEQEKKERYDFEGSKHTAISLMYFCYQQTGVAPILTSSTATLSVCSGLSL
jgi:hypothetical protein